MDLVLVPMGGLNMCTGMAPANTLRAADMFSVCLGYFGRVKTFFEEVDYVSLQRKPLGLPQHPKWSCTSLGLGLLMRRT